MECQAWGRYIHLGGADSDWLTNVDREEKSMWATSRVEFYLELLIIEYIWMLRKVFTNTKLLEDVGKSGDDQSNVYLFFKILLWKVL